MGRIRWTTWLAIACLATAGTRGFAQDVEPGGAAPAQAQKDAVATVDVAQLQALLTRVASGIDAGFGPTDAEALALAAGGLKVDGETAKAFLVKSDGRKMDLRVHVTILPDERARVVLSTWAELAGVLQSEMNAFLDERDK